MTSSSIKFVCALLLFFALACTAVFLLPGKPRLLVLLIVGLLAVKTVLHQMRGRIG